MSSQDFMTTRRKFMQRSALGAGGLLFSSVLLASCTDHSFPDPQNPDIPFLGDASDDWNNNAKLAVTTALQLVPDVGGFISSLVDILWPGSGDSPWDSVKDQVDQLINQKLDTYTYSQATGKLASLKANLQDYLTELKNGTPAEINSSWTAVHENFVSSQSSFTVDGYQVMLLPLFTQFANMFMSILRDPLTPTKSDPGVMTGTTWGMTDADISGYRTNLQDYIAGAVQYVSGAYDEGRANVTSIIRDDDMVEPFRSTNAYDRQMTMLVLDYMDAWPYYDITKYPNGATNPDNTPIPLFTREIYSDPYGNIWIPFQGNPPIILPSQATRFPTQINVWSGSLIDAVQLTYPAGSGPDDVTTTPRMGDQSGAAAGGIITISPDLPIIRAIVTDGYTGSYNDHSMYINTLQFVFSNGNGNTLSTQMGGKSGVNNSGYIGYDYYALSSIYIHGKNQSGGIIGADCIVFGFMRWPQQ